MSSTEAAPRHGSAHQSYPWGFVVPAFAVLAVFFLTPTIYNFIYAFTDWSSFKTTINPVDGAISPISSHQEACGNP